MYLQPERNRMECRAFVVLEHFDRRIFAVNAHTADTRLEKEIHCHGTQVHAAIHLLLSGLSTSVFINNFG